MRRSYIGLEAIGCSTLAYITGYFALVFRCESVQIEIVNRGGSASPRPGQLVEVRTVKRYPLYFCAPEVLFTPVHYLDSRLLRPQYWADSRTEKPERVYR